MIATDQLTPSEVARLKRVHVQAVLRWIWEGVTADGQRVKLGARKVGGRWRISVEALSAFDAEINDRSPGRGRRRNATLRLHAARRQRQNFDRAMESLAAQGLVG